MITLVPFYKDLDLSRESDQLKENIEVFFYKKNLEFLYNTFTIHNPTGHFLLATDLQTNLPFSENNIFRSDLAGLSLMESLTVSNTNLVNQKIGKFVLCGADQLVNKPLDIFFEDNFDIGLLTVGGKINNTIVLLNTNENNLSKVRNFFNRRLEIFYELDDKYKSWFGDQYSYSILLQEMGIEIDNKNKFIESHGLRFKFFEYNVDYVFGSKKSGPAFNKTAVVVDFKGPSRKRWFEQAYKEICNRNKT